ncbi:hypothetical protein TRFO_19109 [Tritrichomonas foetus]|uniref:Uncharacterized protein n=1 Tax=Tritrichomonas foetus TaxID=1144522 RepID=A0A1J4KJQ1_9EUKA|nr:hypothetical protein TRFO_19109 [Tritrichomonas foetus]|eukprot:OHT11467.1 hypothetical protein TRFO_19109 [Tritrichomonas foetus]
MIRFKWYLIELILKNFILSEKVFEKTLAKFQVVMRVSPQQKQANNEAQTFVYTFLQQLDPEIAANYRRESFNQIQSQRNLEKTLSSLPPDFVNVLINTNAPPTDYSSLIYKTKPFSNKENIFQSPQERRKTLLLKYISKIQLTHRIIGHTRCVRLICHDPAKLYFLTVSSDRTMKLWHLNSLSLIYTYKGHESDVITAEISPDRTMIASISADQTIRIWSLINGSCLERILDNALWPFNCVTFSPDSKFIAIASEHGRIIIRYATDIDHNQPPLHRHRFPVHKTVILRDPVRYCCFSPGGRLIAAALHSGKIVVFTVMGSMLWEATMGDNHCDFCFFHPMMPNIVFAFSSKAGIALMYEIRDEMKLIRSYKSKRIFNRMQSCLFALSCDSSLIFACSSTQFIAWSVDDNEKPVGKTEGLPSATEVSPHPQIPYVVAIVCKSSVIIFNAATSTIMNTLNIPDATWKMHSGNWSENGLDFYATDTAGGVSVFRQCSNFDPNAEQSCDTSLYFFPNDFTDSYWDEKLGEVEDSNKKPVHQNPRDKIYNETNQCLCENYRPYPFESIQMTYLPHPSFYALQDIEDRFLTTVHPFATIECESEQVSHSNSNALPANIDEHEAILSSESSSDEEEDAADNGKPQDRYPFWTIVDSPTHNTYFPQIGDRVVYIREGHLQMIADDPSLGETILPSIENEIWWPNIGAFVIQEVHHSKYQCQITMKRLDITARGKYNFLKEIEHPECLDIADAEPARIFDYPIGNAPAFFILAEQFCSSVDAYENMSIGDDVDIYFKQSDFTEKKYTGRILEKYETNTWYNSISLDWGDDSGDDTTYSPWELYSVKKHEVYTPVMPSEMATQAKAVIKVLHAAQSVRSLRPYFKQTFFVPSIIYPSDFGLVKRRLMNNMYRNIISLQFDINSVLDTQNTLPNVTQSDLNAVELLVERLNHVITNPDDVDIYKDFSHFDEDLEDLEERKEREKLAKEREMRGKKRNVYKGQDTFDEDLSDGDFNDPDDIEDQNYEETIIRRSPSRTYGSNRGSSSGTERKKKKNPYDDDDADFHDNEDDFEDDDFVVHGDREMERFKKRCYRPDSSSDKETRRTRGKPSYAGADDSSFDEDDDDDPVILPDDDDDL